MIWNIKWTDSLDTLIHWINWHTKYIDALNKLIQYNDIAGLSENPGGQLVMSLGGYNVPPHPHTHVWDRVNRGQYWDSPVTFFYNFFFNFFPTFVVS